MADAKAALTKEKEAVEGSEEKDIHTSSEINGTSVEEHLTRLIPLTPTHIKDEPKSDVESVPSRRALPSKTTRSCSCCWSKISPLYSQGIMIVVACLGSIGLGTIYAYPAVAMARWEDAHVKFSTSQIMWFATLPVVVMMPASVVAGVVVERLGVRLCLFICTPILSFTWVMIAQDAHFEVLLIARMIQGVVAAVFMVVMGVYPVEVSQVRWRGIMMGMTESMLMLGAFLTYLGGLFLLPKPLAYTFAAVLIPQLILFYYLRETPLWLARRDREDDIVDSLMCLRGRGVDIRPELEHIKTSVYIEKIHRPTAAEQLLLLRKPIYLKPLTLCVLILLFKELTGQYAAVTYTVKMFRMAGSSLDPYLCAVVMGAARFLPCFLSWVLIERLPRRLLLSTCMTVAGVSLAVLGIFLWVWTDSSKAVGPHSGWVPIVCLSIFTVAYGVGVGPIAWAMVAELLPSQIRNIGAGIVNSCFSLFQVLVGLTFPYSVEAVGVGGVFIAYAVCSLCGVVFVITCLPETRGRSFTEIQTNFTSSKKSSSVL